MLATSNIVFSYAIEIFYAYSIHVIHGYYLHDYLQAAYSSVNFI